MSNKIGFLWLEADGKHIRGQSKDTRHLGWIDVLSFERNVKPPSKSGSATLTGERRSPPITITKRIDSSTPLLFQAFGQGQVVVGVCELWKSPVAKESGPHTVVKFEGGQVISIQRTKRTKSELISTSDPLVEDVSFVFSKTTWSSPVAGELQL